MRSIHRQPARPSTCQSSGFAIALSADGSWLAAADDGTGVILVDTRIGAIRSIDVSSEPVRSLAFADDGSALAIGDNAGDIAVVDVASGEQRGSTLVGHTGSVEAISFHPDGVVLASGSSDRTVRLWNTSTQVAIVESLRRHTGTVSGLVWTDRGRVLASSADGEALVWDLRPVSLRDVICRVANRNLTRDEWSTFVGGTYRPTCPTHDADGRVNRRSIRESCARTDPSGIGGRARALS